MATNTNAAALNRLRPLENVNTGSIIEEHIRYWNKYKDENEAKELARRAKQQELQMKLAGDTFELYEGLQPSDVKGFLTAQIMERFEQNKPYYMQLARAAAGGSMEARLKIADEKRKMQTAINASGAYSAKMAELEELKQKGTYNEYLDSEVDRFKDSIKKGKFRFNDDWSLDVYSPALEEAFKGTEAQAFNDGMVRLDSASLLSNDFLNATYHKQPDFIANGSTIAENLLDSVDGNKLVTPQTKTEGIKLVKGLFAQDSTEAQSFFADAQRRGLTSFEKPLGQLDQVEMNTLAERYYEQYVIPNIQEVDNSALNESRRLQNQRTRQLIRQGEREEQEGASRVSLSTDEEGNALVMSSIQTEKGVEPTEISTIFNLGGQPITVGVQGKSGSNRTFNSIARTESGKVYAVGEEISREQIPLFNEDGSPQLDGNGNEKFRIEETVVPYIEENPTILNNIARQLDNEQGKRFNNLSELRTYLNSLERTNTTQESTTQQPTQETREQRIERLRRAASNN